MAKKFFTILLLFIAAKASSQNKISNYELGYYFDINYQMLDGYFDIDYEPIKFFKVSYTIGDNYTPGYYYDLSNNKISGLLKYSQMNTYFKFKPESDAKEKTIKPDECLGYVIGLDSFAVIQNFSVQRELGAFHSDDKEFAEVIDKFSNLTFYKHTRVGINNIVTTYLYRTNNSNNYISFPKGSTKFKETAIPLFGESDLLKTRILSGEYSEEDIPIMIKFLKYKFKYDNNEKIYYSSSWDEVDNINNSSYYAIIKLINKDEFHLSFFLSDSKPIYEGCFTSFYPHKKVKDFIWYYPNGVIRKKVSYKENKPQKATTYFQNGEIHYEYLCQYSENDMKPLFYSKVYNLEGKEVLNSLGCGIEVFYDSITNKQISYEFIENKLINSFYIDSSNRKIYQLCEKNARLKEFRFIQSNLNSENLYPLNSIKNNNHGFALIRCIVEPSGMASKFEFIKGVDNDCNVAILNFLTLNNVLNSWKPARVGKENVSQEIVIPIDFSIESFSRYRNNYNNFWMMQHMMMQQQMIMNTIPPQMNGFR